VEKENRGLLKKTASYSHRKQGVPVEKKADEGKKPILGSREKNRRETIYRRQLTQGQKAMILPK